MIQDAKIHRKMNKLARRLAEANTWTDAEHTKTLASFGDVVVEALQLIRLAGYKSEYDKRSDQIVKNVRGRA